MRAQTLDSDSPPLDAGRSSDDRARPAAARALAERLFAPLDIASLVYFRIAFGAIMLVEVWRYFSYDWIGRYFIVPSFHFTYYGFDWARPWPGNGMYLHFIALGVLAGCMLLGLWYRVSATLFFLGFTYVFLLEQARYLNHFYLVSLVSLLLIFIPAHRAGSLDARWRPALRSEVAPAWALWLLRIQIGIVYFYGALAKLNPDWLRGEPMRIWLANRADRPLVGPLFTEEWVVYLFSYGGLLCDLLIFPLLLWSRTRLLGLAAAVAFNLMNAWLFQIGIFPWFMLAATLLFFPPDWPRRLLRGASGSGREGERESGRAGETARSLRLSISPSLPLALLGLYLAVQLLAPLRHHLYPGEVSWTEEGHQFAWRMKLRDKSARATFVATDPATGRTWPVDSRPYLTSWQREEMEREPDLILQFAHHLANDLRRQGHARVEIRATAQASLNGRRRQPLIDPTVDLAAQPRTLLPASWIVPLREPLEARASLGR